MSFKSFQKQHSNSNSASDRRVGKCAGSGNLVFLEALPLGLIGSLNTQGRPLPLSISVPAEQERVVVLRKVLLGSVFGAIKDITNYILKHLLKSKGDSTQNSTIC